MNSDGTILNRSVPTDTTGREITVGSKVRPIHGHKVRLVTAVSEYGNYFQWGNHGSWRRGEDYVREADDALIDHSTEWR